MVPRTAPEVNLAQTNGNICLQTALFHHGQVCSVSRLRGESQYVTYGYSEEICQELANHTSSPIPFTPAHSPVYAIPVTLLSQWSSFSLRQPPQLEKPLQGPCYTSPWRLCVVRGIGP
ncbi:unnamed protein product [Boreogadus saida]